MSESTMVIGARKNGNQYFIPIVEETSAINYADLVAEFSTTKLSGFFRCTECTQNCAAPKYGF
ncbi:hypothetical protein [Acetobacterium sp. MES1]|uniref:hypothetical protein n=1 Tax=Acetobacterium sp. MES1 TaxID=1899015 RepID=UPI00257ACDCB|nr:hypothetical protein [Acetobacterium sp. MES1]